MAHPFKSERLLYRAATPYPTSRKSPAPNPAAQVRDARIGRDHGTVGTEIEEVADWISAQLDDEQYEEYVGLDDDELAGGCPCCRDFSNLFSFPGANHNTPAPFQNPFHNKQASPFHMKRC